MKKLLSITLMMMLVLSLIAPISYAGESELEKVLKDIGKTNREIDEMIYEAVEKAEGEIIKYVKDLEVLEKGKEVVKLEKEILGLREELVRLDINKNDYQDKLDKINNEISKTEDKILRITDKQKDREDKLLNEIKELKLALNMTNTDDKKNIKILGSINKFQAQLDKSDREIEELNQKLDTKINKIINRLIDDTNEKAANMKARGASKGFTIICEWVEVEIGGQNVWIDPLRVAGF